MKKIIIIITILLIVKGTKAQIIKAELIATGLTCSMCSFATQKQLQTITFIDSIATDLNHTTFILFFKKDAIVDFVTIKNKVEDAGFSVGSLICTFVFSGQKVENNFHYQYQNTLFHFMETKPQILNGKVRLKIIDKGFLSAKEFKKNKNMATKNPCYETGKMDGVERLYHVTIL